MVETGLQPETLSRMGDLEVLRSGEVSHDPLSTLFIIPNLGLHMLEKGVSTPSDPRFEPCHYLILPSIHIYTPVEICNPCMPGVT